MYTSCQQIRRMLIKHSTVNVNTGATTDKGSEWVTRPCGAPLFGDELQKRGTCRSCNDGWTHEHNYAISEASIV